MYKILPMTRLGLATIQQNRSKVIKKVNELLYNDELVFRVEEKIRCTTEKFPEGHLLFPGSIVVSCETLLEKCQTDLTNEDITSFLSRLSLVKRIAFFDGLNCGTFCSDPFYLFFQTFGLKVDRISDADIRNGILNEYELLIVPGGPDAGESYYEGLGEKGYEEIREFVRKGGKYLGSCAGSYFPLRAEPNTIPSDVWLNMIPATDLHGLDYWRTGTGFVRVEFEDVTHPVALNVAMGNPSTIDMIYWEGPAFELLEGADIHVIARYKDFIASGKSLPSWSLENNEIAENAMKWANPLTSERFDEHLKGYPAIIEATYGKGHMVLFSPHAEFGTCGTDHSMDENPNFLLLMNSIYYLSGRGE
ncbi:BPL-N domain-containing protein [Psychrobacillus sp. L4]|uniref:BPL-N domain-containing protein n=1 Tax=Psychrobacillus sp. L4 TaxID=3236892 RepID=UPI0036F38D47